MSYYQGPKSDHFNGVRFFNPNKARSLQKASFWKWRMTRPKSKWPKFVANEFEDIPPSLVNDNIRISFVGHISFLIQFGGINILVDPVWSDIIGPFNLFGVKRVNKPGIEFTNLPKIDIVLISHNHYDHLDLATIKKLQKRDNPLFVMPLGNDKMLNHIVKYDQIKLLDWNESTIIRDLKINLVPVQHWSKRTLFDTNKALWGGFVIESNLGKIFFAGDTGFGEGDNFKNVRKQYGPMDISFLPIGSYKPEWFMEYSHMNPMDAVKTHLILESKLSIATHFGTFDLADDEYDEPVRDLNLALIEHNLPTQQFRALKVGESIIVN